MDYFAENGPLRFSVRPAANSFKGDFYSGFDVMIVLNALIQDLVNHSYSRFWMQQ